MALDKSEPTVHVHSRVFDDHDYSSNWSRCMIHGSSSVCVVYIAYKCIQCVNSMNCTRCMRTYCI